MHYLAAGVGSEWDRIWDPRDSVSLSSCYGISKGLMLFPCGNEYIFVMAEVVEICALG